MTRWIGAVGPVGRFKLDNFLGGRSEQVRADDGTNRGQRDDLTTAARGVHGFVFGSMLEKSSQTIDAVSVTTGNPESVWFKPTLGAAHTRNEFPCRIGPRKDSRVYLAIGSGIGSRKELSAGWRMGLM